MGFGTERAVMPEGGDVFQYEVSVPISGRAGQDGVMERLGFGSAAGAWEVWVLIGPGGVGGQVTLRRSHLVDPSCQELC